MRLEPVNNRVIVEIVELPEKTSGGVYLSESTRQKSTAAVVIAVGPKARAYYGRGTRSVSPGDRVLCLRWSGHAVDYEDKRYVVLEDSDILCIEVDDDDVEESDDVEGSRSLVSAVYYQALTSGLPVAS